MPVLVAVPGTMCAPSVFRRLAERLTERTGRPGEPADRPGEPAGLSGESAGRSGDVVRLDAVSWMTEPGPWDIATIADRIALRHSEPVLVLGHSTGGAIALQLAVSHPRLVAGLLVVDSGAHMHGHGDVDRILATVETGWGPKLHKAVLDRSFATPPGAADRAELLDYAAMVPRQAALDALRSQRELDLTPRLAELRCPVTVLHGVLDPTRTLEQARDLAAAIPGARLRYLDTGHTPVYEAPDLVATEVIALCDRIPGLR
ncbi:MAG TPA: alpha/beta hydrolase [Pseudonocardiaceae bacterium]|jgi:pimeloyl-ACP methyl ester carboxylesterase|nr:alpha/beta hydrolase [Pseudonocardiaceae bacterium]